MSVAPEIARLAETVLLVTAQPGAYAGGTTEPESRPGPDAVTAGRPTLGTLARHLRMLAAAPERWWELVRFDRDRSVKIWVDRYPSYHAWLMVLPPGHPGPDCDCDAATMIAGEAAEGGAVLRPGSVRVHGQPHRLHGRGAGYSISLHVRGQAFSATVQPDVLG